MTMPSTGVASALGIATDPDRHISCGTARSRIPEPVVLDTIHRERKSGMGRYGMITATYCDRSLSMSYMFTAVTL